MMSDNIHERFDFDAQLTKRAGHFLVDVWVFDDHFASAMTVKVRHSICELKNIFVAYNKHFCCVKFKFHCHILEFF